MEFKKKKLSFIILNKTEESWVSKSRILLLPKLLYLTGFVFRASAAQNYSAYLWIGLRLLAFQIKQTEQTSTIF